MAIRGTFKDANFFEMIQVMYSCKKTGRMEVTSDKKWAMVIFLQGELWHIEPRGFESSCADEVMHAMIVMPEGNFVFQSLPWLPDLERSITLTTANIIDKYSQEKEALAPGETFSAKNIIKALSLKDNAEAKIRYVPHNVRKILQFIDGMRTKDEVIALCQLKKSNAEQILQDLALQEIIEEVDFVPAQAPAEAVTS